MFDAHSIWKDICDYVHELHQQGFFIYIISHLRVYEVVSKIFWTGAAIYTAVVVARSTGRW